ncbi:MAG: ABC transporter substrate-binding protein [Xenococcaceae cyanobacterium]
MSSKNKPLLLLVLALLAIAGIAYAVLWGLKPTKPPRPRLSIGEKILVKEQTNPEKQAGVQGFSSGDFDTAITKLEESLKVNRNDPEALIYLNNAKAKAANQPVLKIAVSVPIDRNLYVAQEILRGVAQAQDEVNREGGINGALLIVEIANDDNEPKIVEKLANEFVEDSDILAVVGHNSNNASLAAAPFYSQGGLVMVSPTSTSSELSGNNKYWFRTVPINRWSAEGLSRHVSTVLDKKIAICFDSESSYSKSFKEDFDNAMSAEGDRIAQTKCDFSAPNFNPFTIMSQIINEGTDGLLLIPSVDKHPQAIEMTRANAVKLRLFASENLYTFNTLDQGRADVEGMVLAVSWHPKAIPGHPFPDNAFNLWGGEVNWRTAMAYDATLAIIAGLKQGNTREELQKALSSEDFSVEGATGTFKFDEAGDRQGEVYLLRIESDSNSSNGTGYDFVLLR